VQKADCEKEGRKKRQKENRERERERESSKEDDKTYINTLGFQLSQGQLFGTAGHAIQGDFVHGFVVQCLENEQQKKKTREESEHCGVQQTSILAHMDNILRGSSSVQAFERERGTETPT
jgi:hypothetical protein